MFSVKSIVEFDIFQQFFLTIYKLNSVLNLMFARVGTRGLVHPVHKIIVVVINHHYLLLSLFKIYALLILISIIQYLSLHIFFTQIYISAFQ